MVVKVVQWRFHHHPAHDHQSGAGSEAGAQIIRGKDGAVLGYNYPGDRGKGLAFERDGVGGLIRAGYFRSLFLPREGARAYDGAGLESYRARLDVGSWSVYELRR